MYLCQFEADVAFRWCSPRDQTPLGQLRQMVESTDSRSIPGDPAKMAEAIVSVASQPSAPLRLTLGSDAYQLVRGALQTRLAALDAQVAIAQSTDVVVG